MLLVASQPPKLVLYRQTLILVSFMIFPRLSSVTLNSFQLLTQLFPVKNHKMISLKVGVSFHRSLYVTGTLCFCNEIYYVFLILIYLVCQMLQLFVPSLKVNEVCKMFHSCPVRAHMGITATQRKIERRFWWPGMLKDMANFICCCYYCQTQKPTQFSVASHTF